MAIYLKKGKSENEINEIDKKIQHSVKEIIDNIKEKGDEEVRSLSIHFDNWNPKSFKLSDQEINQIIENIPQKTKDDIDFAQKQIRNFAQKQKETIKDLEIETYPGVTLGHKNIPINNVGCYIPGGKYPIIASAHMSVLIAKAAGVKRVVACTPPISGEIPKETVYSMVMAGADEIYILGGVQALASMALGTKTISPVDMIVGPGNPFVAEAKRQLFGEVGIDLLAGPSEILVIADETADAEMIATDILGQSEHGYTSPSALITTSEKLANQTLKEIKQQLKKLPTAEIAGKAWADNGSIILVKDQKEAVIEADKLAYEHVQVITKDPDYFLNNLTNYGALFLGPETSVAYGDKVIGTNHILPTNKASRYTGGLWVGKFLKNVSYQQITPKASVEIGEYAARLCELENLLGHKEQAMIRIKRFEK